MSIKKIKFFSLLMLSLSAFSMESENPYQINSDASDDDSAHSESNIAFGYQDTPPYSDGENQPSIANNQPIYLICRTKFERAFRSIADNCAGYETIAKKLETQLAEYIDQMFSENEWRMIIDEIIDSINVSPALQMTQNFALMKLNLSWILHKN